MEDRKEERLSDSQDNLGKLWNALLRLLGEKTNAFVVCALYHQIQLLDATDCNLPFRNPTTTPSLTRFPRSGDEGGSVHLPHTRSRPGAWGGAQNEGGRWRGRAHLFDLGLQVPQLEALLQPLMGLLCVELQFVLLLMEKLQ